LKERPEQQCRYGGSPEPNMKKFHGGNLAVLTSNRPLVLAFALLATPEGQQTLLAALSTLE
jgi:hypothetical protein